MWFQASEILSSQSSDGLIYMKMRFDEWISRFKRIKESLGHGKQSGKIWFLETLNDTFKLADDQSKSNMSVSTKLKPLIMDLKFKTIYLYNL